LRYEPRKSEKNERLRTRIVELAQERNPFIFKDVAFRTSFGLRPEKTENQGAIREKMAGERRGVLEGCETGATSLKTRGNRKPVTPENDPRETGCLFSNGGGGGRLHHQLNI